MVVVVAVMVLAVVVVVVAVVVVVVGGVVGGVEEGGGVGGEGVVVGERAIGADCIEFSVRSVVRGEDVRQTTVVWHTL